MVVNIETPLLASLQTESIASIKKQLADGFEQSVKSSQDLIGPKLDKLETILTRLKSKQGVA